MTSLTDHECVCLTEGVGGIFMCMDIGVQTAWRADLCLHLCTFLTSGPLSTTADLCITFCER